MYDTASLALAGAEQASLLARVAALAPHVTVIVMLLNARPVTFGGALGTDLLDGVGALLAGFRLGEEGGTAVFDILSGAANPSGKLPMSWPRSVGQIFGPASPYLYPFQGDHMWEDYTDAPSSPLFPFGRGFSYSAWAFSQDAKATRTATGFTITVTLFNVGAVDGAQTVFVFLEDVVCSIVRVASRQIVAFDKVIAPAHGSAALSIDVPFDRLAVWTEGGAFVLEPGDFIFYIALEGPGAKGVFDAQTTVTVRVTV